MEFHRFFLIKSKVHVILEIRKIKNADLNYFYFLLYINFNQYI